MTRARSETDLSSAPNRKPFTHVFDEEERKGVKGIGARSRTASFGAALLSFSELEEDEGGVGVRDGELKRVLVEGGGGGGWDNNDGGGSGFWDSNHGNDGTDLYYRAMIEANPGNPLFLSNYARYLKEVRQVSISICFCQC